MSEIPFERLRLKVMQDILPIGMGMLDRLKKGETNKIVELFSSSSDPLEELRSEGDLAAQSIRDQLDQINPGLGNPVMEVKVEVDNSNFKNSAIENDSSLREILLRIEDRLDSLKRHLNETEI